MRGRISRLRESPKRRSPTTSRPAGSPDPDLLIRTGGDQRISNFLLWQCAYAELYFTDAYWPDFGREDIDIALAEYGRRKRKFGGLLPEDIEAFGKT